MNLLDLPPARDGDASLLGRLGLKNDLACWLIAKGHGDFLGMLPSEIENWRREPPPACPSDYRHGPMRLRGLDWVCFECEPPYRRRRNLKALYAEGRIEDHIGEIVESVYTPYGWQTRTEAL